MVLLELEGSSNLIAFGLTSVEVSIKNISKRKTRSDMEAMLNSVLILFCDLIAMDGVFSPCCAKKGMYYFAGS
jgi:hypothetical protein